jgi:hypothetical protein
MCFGCRGAGVSRNDDEESSACGREGGVIEVECSVRHGEET